VFGGASTQLIDVLEVMIEGMAVSSVAAAMNLARASTLHATISALAAPHSDGGLFPNITSISSAALVSTFTAATTQPTPSNTVTDAKLTLALNLFGGVNRWNAAPTQQWQIIGNVAPGGESVLFNSTTGGGATGLANTHIMYEPY
jgi:hypothetical protein